MTDGPDALGFDCDWQLGLNLRSSRTGCVGFILSFSGLGGLDLRKDIEVPHPVSDREARTIVGQDQIGCVGLIHRFRYEGGDEDPIRIEAYVSKGSAANVRAKLAKPLADTSLSLAWYIVDFDPETKVWYEAAFLKSQKAAKANVDSTGGSLQLFVDNEATNVADHLDIGVYRLEVQVVPADKKRATLEFATGPRSRLVKRWGS